MIDYFNKEVENNSRIENIFSNNYNRYSKNLENEWQQIIEEINLMGINIEN